MLTSLLAVFAMLSLAWALHDGQAARERQNRDKH
jgi:hypothetical protein